MNDHNRAVNFKGQEGFFISEELLSITRAIFLIEKQPIYIPNQNNETAIYFNNYQEYWTFQGLISLLFNSKISLDAFEKYESVPKFIYKNNSSDVIVYFSSDQALNAKLKKGILYFGIEVGEIFDSENKTPIMKFQGTDKDYSINEFGDFYKEYLTRLLRHPNNVIAIQTVFKNKVNSIKINEHENGKLDITINNEEKIEWNNFVTMKPTLSLINYLNLSSYHKYNHKNITYNQECNECSNIKCLIYSKRWNSNDKSVDDRKQFCSLIKDFNNIHLTHKLIRKNKGLRALQKRIK